MQLLNSEPHNVLLYLKFWGTIDSLCILRIFSHTRKSVSSSFFRNCLREKEIRNTLTNFKSVILNCFIYDIFKKYERRRDINVTLQVKKGEINISK